MTVNVYHKHSEVRNDTPPPEMLERGEIAICTNQDSAHLFIKDTANAVRLIGGDWWPVIEGLQEKVEILFEILGGIPDPANVAKLIKELASIHVELKKLEKQIEWNTDNINALAIKVEDLENQVKALAIAVEKHDDRLDVLETIDITAGTDIDVEQTDTYKWTISLDQETQDQIDELQTIVVDGGKGIKVKRTDAYRFKVEIDEDWLENFVEKALEPYMLKDIKTNTDALG